MNIDARYRSSHPPTAPTAEALDDLARQLATHGDPSTRGGVTRSGRVTGGNGIAWVRPTEIAAYASPLIGRGIDLQAELIRRARRTPATTARSLRRAAIHPRTSTVNSNPAPSPSRHSAPAPQQEGPQL